MPNHTIARIEPGRLLLAALAACLLLPAGCRIDRKTAATVIAGGDCLLDRYDGRLGYDPEKDRRWDALVAAKSDAFIFNLETTVGMAGSPEKKEFVFRAPERALAPLARFPRPIAALANNHILDYGPEGLLATTAALDAAGIAHAGAGATLRDAWTEARSELPNGTLSFISCGYGGAIGSRCAVAPIDAEKLVERIRGCRTDSAAVVVMFHWGVELSPDYAEADRRIAHALVDAGADLVLGSGPHVLQGIEAYRCSLICFSLGNLIFDSLGDEETSAGILVRMRLVRRRDGRIEKSFEAAPLRTTVRSVGPTAPALRDAEGIMENISRRSPDPGIMNIRRHYFNRGLYWFPFAKR